MVNQIPGLMRCNAKLILFIIFTVVALASCSSDRDTSINYLGQDPPGISAEVFAPGLISTDSIEHSAPSFSPDGKIVLWTVLDRMYHASMMEMTFENGRWSAPHRASFADSTADDYYPSFSPDGKKLYFSSRRKVHYEENGSIRIWEVERTAHGWGTPAPFDSLVSDGEDYAHSITSKGTLYFSTSQGGSTNWNLMRSEKVNGAYTVPELLPYSINSVGYEDGPYVAPDESFIIFDSQRPDGLGGGIDLYISFKKEGKGWMMPVNMGPKINSHATERFARLSPDGKYFFFGSTRNASATSKGFDIFWIDAAVIDELRKGATAQIKIDQPLGQDIIASLRNDEIDSASGKLKRWLARHPNSLDATIVYSSLVRRQKNYPEAERVLQQNPVMWAENTAVIMEKALVKFGLNKDDEALRILVPILVEGDQLRERYIYLSNALLGMGRFEVSDDYFEKAMTLHASPSPYYSRGCVYAKMGQKDKAFVALNRAVDLGMRVRKEYEDNPDLTKLRDDVRWKMLMEKL
jgi:Tol biopolymer transport system component